MSPIETPADSVGGHPPPAWSAMSADRTISTEPRDAMLPPGVVSDTETARCRGIGGAVEFREAWADYRTHLLVDSDLAHSTVAEYGSVLRRWNRYLEQRRTTWDQAGKAHLDRFLNRPATTGARKGQPISVNRRRTDIVAIHGFYRYCALAALIDRDPLAVVRLPRRREGPPRSFTQAQLATILRAARSDNRMHLLVWLAYGAGLRRAEIAALDLADLDRHPWPGRLRVIGKGGRERWVPLKDKVRRILDRHLGDRANLTAGPLVENRTHPGKPLTAGSVGDLLAGHIRDAGIEVGSGHWLRHTFAYLALEAAEGTNLEELREGMGHADSRTTRRYGKRYQWNVKRRVTDILPDPEGPLAVLFAAALLIGG